ncbi:PIN domain-containing protein [Desulfofundulus thermobenzoicus]|uniref:PIN domain-containing protein n=1 Tax=Desulfofundulus thermobenzoicus TaxID=29376 RepID=A0A6N7INL2_9FIRM|nr:PIN domain-containing protein [Desulfofundulus thermobenzoicus]MQL51554.1 PIN domain-containing protein [Desulfofundulus thermobenzoicus]
MNVLVDSSAVLALLNGRNQWHHAAVAVLEHLVSGKVCFLMTNFLIAETHTLLLSRMGRDIAREWLLNYDWNIIHITREDEALAGEIIGKYRDKDFSFIDATGFIIMQKYNLRPAFTFDWHFKQFGFETAGI